jgi:lipid-binding SYLF domain-containing protein
MAVELQPVSLEVGMNNVIAAAAVLFLTASSALATEAGRLTAAAAALQEVRSEIPAEYWTRARCALVIPDLKKAAFISAGEYGKGVMSCRGGDQWSAPVFMQMAKGSWGFQAGVEQADLILLVMNESGVQKLLKNRVNLGADAAVAAGPLVRTGGATTGAVATAEILSYSRSKGLFAGIDLSGGVLRPDDEANKSVYGSSATPSTILATREISAPPEATSFLSALRTIPATQPTQPNSSTPTAAATRSSTAGAGDEDARARVVDIQQALDRMLADTTPSAVGTAGSTEITGGTVAIDRGRLLQIRQQLDALLAALNRR